MQTIQQQLTELYREQIADAKRSEYEAKKARKATKHTPKGITPRTPPKRGYNYSLLEAAQ